MGVVAVKTNISRRLRLDGPPHWLGFDAEPILKGLGWKRPCWPSQAWALRTSDLPSAW
jgi:hypothetical protein